MSSQFSIVRISENSLVPPWPRGTFSSLLISSIGIEVQLCILHWCFCRLWCLFVLLWPTYSRQFLQVRSTTKSGLKGMEGSLILLQLQMLTSGLWWSAVCIRLSTWSSFGFETFGALRSFQDNPWCYIFGSWPTRRACFRSCGSTGCIIRGWCSFWGFLQSLLLW